MIKVPIEIGDTILTGKFRNHKVVVEKIGVDKNGHPTVNGKPILKIRIQKLMNKVTGNTINIKDIISCLTKTNPELSELIMGSINLQRVIKVGKLFKKVEDRLKEVEVVLKEIPNNETDVIKELKEEARELQVKLNKAIELTKKSMHVKP